MSSDNKIVAWKPICGNNTQKNRRPSDSFPFNQGSFSVLGMELIIAEFAENFWAIQSYYKAYNHVLPGGVPVWCGTRFGRAWCSSVLHFISLPRKSICRHELLKSIGARSTWQNNFCFYILCFCFCVFCIFCHLALIDCWCGISGRDLNRVIAWVIPWVIPWG